MARLILIPGLAGDSTMWREQLAGLAPWQPVVTDAHTRADSIPAMASELLRQHEG